MKAGCAVTLLALLPTVVHAAVWSDEVGSKCEDSLNLYGTALGGSLAPTAHLAIGNGAQGQIATFSAKQINDGEISLGKRFSSGIVQLSKPQLDFLKETIKKQAESKKIPWYLDPFIPEVQVEQMFVKKSLQEVQAYLRDKLSDQVATLDQLALFVADGGQLVRAGLIAKNPANDGQFIFVDMTEYTIQLGKERRSFLLASCSYPAKPRITKMVVTYDGGSAVSFDEISQTEWKKSSRATGSLPLTKYAEDDDFFYFQQVCASEEFCIRHRIGKWKPSWGVSFEQQDSLTGPHYYPPWDMSDTQPTKVAVQ